MAEGDNRGPYQQDPFTHIVEIHFPSKKVRFLALQVQYAFDRGVIPGIGWLTHEENPDEYGGGLYCSPPEGAVSVGSHVRSWSLKTLYLYRQEHGFSMYWHYFASEVNPQSPSYTEAEWKTHTISVRDDKAKTWGPWGLVDAFVNGLPDVPADPTFPLGVVPTDRYGMGLGESVQANWDWDVRFAGADGDGDVPFKTPEIPFSPNPKKFHRVTSCQWEVYGRTITSGRQCLGAFDMDPSWVGDATKTVEWEYYTTGEQVGFNGDVDAAYMGDTHHSETLDFSTAWLMYGTPAHRFNCVGLSTRRDRRFVWLLFEREDLIGTPYPP